MSYAKKTVTVERLEDRGVISCDGPGCDGEVVDDLNDSANPPERAAWFRLTKGGGAMAACSLILDACSHACLLRIVQSLEVTL